jgi:glycosyltransferase involved in cell wall biosynthesis
MLDYFAAGLAVVTTQFGARGLMVEPGVHAYVVSDDELEAALAKAIGADEAKRAAMTVAARRHVEKHFDWSAIADQVEATWREMGLV